MQLHVYKAILKGAFAALFIGSGVLHFVKHEGYVRLMPPALPYPRELVYISGVIEGGLGALLLVPRARRFAAWALIPTLIAIFPANVHAALTAGTDHEAMPGVPVWAAWLRLPVQGVLIAWAYRYTRPE
jgi:uncharacterized membrane protein